MQNGFVESFNFDGENAVAGGQLELESKGATVECARLLMQDIPAELPKLLA